MSGPPLNEILRLHLIYLKKNSSFYTYVGYTRKDLNKNERLYLHNTSKGAKYTKGKKLETHIKKVFFHKSLALKEEYKLKKNYLLRNKIKKNLFKMIKYRKIKNNLVHNTAIINWKDLIIGKGNKIGPYVVIGNDAQHPKIIKVLVK